MRKTPPKKLSDTARRLIPLLLRMYLMFLAPLAFFQRSLIYHPSRCERLAARDARLPQTVVDVTVRSHDGLDLHGWLALVGTTSDSGAIDAKRVLAQGRPVVLFFPGNAGNRSMRSIQISVLGSLNAHVLLVDYRGYADNDGQPSETNFARDARTVWNYLTGELGVSPQRVVIYGESLGGGVATHLASDLCLEGIEPGGLVVQSTFSSLVAVGQAHFPVLPVALILMDRFRSDSRIPWVTCPILQIHGQQDSIIPFWIGQRLFDAAPAKSSRGIEKQQVVLPDTDHNNVYSEGQDRDTFIAELKRFLGSLEQPLEPKFNSANGVAPLRPDLTVAAGRSRLLNWMIYGSLLLAALGILVWWMIRGNTLK